MGQERSAEHEWDQTTQGKETGPDSGWTKVEATKRRLVKTSLKIDVRRLYKGLMTKVKRLRV